MLPRCIYTLQAWCYLCPISYHELGKRNAHIDTQMCLDFSLNSAPNLDLDETSCAMNLIGSKFKIWNLLILGSLNSGDGTGRNRSTLHPETLDPSYMISIKVLALVDQLSNYVVKVSTFWQIILHLCFQHITYRRWCNDKRPMVETQVHAHVSFCSGFTNNSSRNIDR